MPEVGAEHMARRRRAATRHCHVHLRVVLSITHGPNHKNVHMHSPNTRMSICILEKAMLARGRGPRGRGRNRNSEWVTKGQHNRRSSHHFSS